MSIFRLALHNLCHIVGDARRADMLRAAHGILRLKVVEIALGNDFDNGHSLRLMVPQNSDSEFTTLDITLDKHLIIDIERFLQSLFDGFRALYDEHADSAALGTGLHNNLLTHRRDDLLDINLVTLVNRQGRRSGDTLALVEDLCLHLVHGKRARPHARARVRDADDIEQTLHRTVFAIFAMQAEERHVERFLDQTLQVFLVRRIDISDGKTRRLQSFASTLTGCQGNFTLVAFAAAQKSNTTRTRIDT